MMLCLMARDAAAKKLDNLVIPVSDFIQELLTPSADVLLIQSQYGPELAMKPIKPLRIHFATPAYFSTTSLNSMTTESSIENTFGVLSLVGQQASVQIFNTAPTS